MEMVCLDVLAAPEVVVSGVLLLVLSSNPVWGNKTNILNGTTNSTNSGTDNTAAIVAPVVTFSVLAIVLSVLGWLFCKVKKKRQTEGTYRPSAEEQSGVRSVAVPDALKLPKEERLI